MGCGYATTMQVRVYSGDAMIVFPTPAAQADSALFRSSGDKNATHERIHPRLVVRQRFGSALDAHLHSSATLCSISAMLTKWTAGRTAAASPSSGG